MATNKTKAPIIHELKHSSVPDDGDYYLYVEVYGNEGCTFKIEREDSDSEFPSTLVFASPDITKTIIEWSSLTGKFW